MCNINSVWITSSLAITNFYPNTKQPDHTLSIASNSRSDRRTSSTSKWSTRRFESLKRSTNEDALAMINICHGLAVPAVSSSNDVHLITSCV